MSYSIIVCIQPVLAELIFVKQGNRNVFQCIYCDKITARCPEIVNINRISLSQTSENC